MPVSRWVSLSVSSRSASVFSACTTGVAIALRLKIRSSYPRGPISARTAAKAARIASVSAASSFLASGYWLGQRSASGLGGPELLLGDLGRLEQIIKVRGKRHVREVLCLRVRASLLTSHDHVGQLSGSYGPASAMPRYPGNTAYARLASHC